MTWVDGLRGCARGCVGGLWGHVFMTKGRVTKVMLPSVLSACPLPLWRWMHPEALFYSVAVHVHVVLSSCLPQNVRLNSKIGLECGCFVVIADFNVPDLPMLSQCIN